MHIYSADKERYSVWCLWPADECKSNIHPPCGSASVFTNSWGKYLCLWQLKMCPSAVWCWTGTYSGFIRAVPPKTTQWLPAISRNIQDTLIRGYDHGNFSTLWGLNCFISPPIKEINKNTSAGTKLSPICILFDWTAQHCSLKHPIVRSLI